MAKDGFGPLKSCLHRIEDMLTAASWIEPPMRDPYVHRSPFLKKESIKNLSLTWHTLSTQGLKLETSI